MNLRQSETGKPTDRMALRALDLGQQESGPQFRMLRSIHETFARSVSNVLSTFLQSEIVASLSGIHSTTAGDFHKTLPNPSCLIKLRLHPEQERMILYLESATVLTLLDVFLGGTGLPSSAPRELTEIEWSLLEEISQVLVRCLGESWQVIKSAEFVVEWLGSDPSLMPGPEPATSVLRIPFELQLGQQTGYFEIAVPRSFFDAASNRELQEVVEDFVSPDDIERNARLLGDAEVELEVLLEGTQLSFGELRALEKGQVVRFDHGLNEPLRGLVNGDFSVSGHILSAGRKRAFQVEEAPTT